MTFRRKGRAGGETKATGNIPLTSGFDYAYAMNGNGTKNLGGWGSVACHREWTWVFVQRRVGISGRQRVVGGATRKGRKCLRSARCSLRNVTYIRVVNVVHTRPKQRAGHERGPWLCFKKRSGLQPTTVFLFIHHQLMDFIKDHYAGQWTRVSVVHAKTPPQGDSRWWLL